MKQGEVASLLTTVYSVLLSRVKSRGHKPCNCPTVCTYLQTLQKSNNTPYSQVIYPTPSCHVLLPIPISASIHSNDARSWRLIASCVVSRYWPFDVHIMSASKSAYILKVLIHFISSSFVGERSNRIFDRTANAFLAVRGICCRYLVCKACKSRAKLRLEFKLQTIS